MKTIALLSLALISCSDSSDETTTDPTELGMTVTSTEVVLAAGEERWICWSWPVETPFQMTATQLVTSSPLIHHYQLFEVQTDPKMNATDCAAQGTRDAVWLSVGGYETSGITYPAGTAMPVSGFIMMQLHVLNAGDSPITIPQFSMKLTGTNDEGLLPVGVLVVAPDDINIPPKTFGMKIAGTCNPPETVENIVAIYPHMHMLGRKIRVGVGATDLVNIDWDFEKQSIYPVAGSAAMTDSMHVECTYDNPSDRTVTFGDSTTDEMCAGIIYHYPAETDFTFCGGR